VSWVRRLSPRAEKTIRLVTVFALDSEAWGYASAAIVLAGILAGPLVAWLLSRPRDGQA